MSSAYHLGGAGQDDRKLNFSAVGFAELPMFIIKLTLS
jgi:hypothetical protein